MIIIRPLSVRHMYEYGMDLLKSHYEELCRDKETYKLNVDWEKYKVLEKAGVLHAIAMYHKDDFIGYGVFIIQNHAHYKDTVVALNDVLLLDKKYRTAGYGSELINACESLCKSKGAREIIFNCKYGYPLGDILRAKGYGPCEYSMSRLL